MTSHLDALNLRLSHERDYLASASSEGERALRAVWVAQIEREIEREAGFVTADAEPTDEELLRELRA